MTRRTDNRARRLARAFSLVEVLIAVLVLALGLLGLGAVFPMVMREQRIATQTTLGVSARNAAEQVLFANPAFSRSGGDGWRALREYVLDNGGENGDWVAVVPEARDLSRLNAYVLPLSDAPDPFVIPISQRLFPMPYSTGQEPRFVWDLAARLTQSNPARRERSPLQVALFLRPIDPAIRPPIDNSANPRRPYPVVDALANSSLPGNARRNPISVDRQGRPTQDGRRDRGGNYAIPIVAEADGPGADPDINDQIILRRVIQPAGLSVDDAAALLIAPGQRFMDFRGRVYTITRSDVIGGRARRGTFSPPMTDVDGDGRVDSDDYNPILFLPQAPAVDPFVFTVNP
jgi:hypothetical protein